LAIDPAATYASAIRTPALLPNAKLVVDDFQLTKLADDALTKVRRRVTWELMTVAAARSTRSGPTGAVC
jgi:transposase